LIVALHFLFLFGSMPTPRGPKFIAALARIPLRKLCVKFLDPYLPRDLLAKLLFASGRATKMHKWRVGPVQTVSGGSFWGSGFVLYDETGKPCVTFGYFNESYAKAGHEHVVAALANAASVISAKA